MKKFKFVSLILLIAMLLVVGCQPATPAEEPAAEEPAAEEPAAEEPAAEEPAAEEPMDEMPEDDWGVIEIPAGESIRVAVNVVTSGAGVDVLGLDELRGAELSAIDFGEVFGREVEVVHEDTLCNAEGGQAAASKTVSDPTVVAVVGHTCSSSCTPAAEIYTDAGYTMISPSCTAPALTNPETHQLGFMRTAFNDLGQGAAAADFAYNELGARNVATIHDGSPYAEQLVAVFTENFEALGGTIVAAEAVNVGDTDMRPVLTTIAETEPDMIYVPIFPAEGGFIAQQRFDVGLDDVAMMGADGLQASTFIEAAGDAGEGFYVSGPAFSTDPRYADFLAAYDAAYGEQPPAPFHAHSYDAMTMILTAVQEVGVEASDGTLYVGRKALNDALYNISGLDGLIGDIECDENGDCGFALAIAVLQVQDGEFVQVN